MVDARRSSTARTGSNMILPVHSALGSLAARMYRLLLVTPKLLIFLVVIGGAQRARVPARTPLSYERVC